MDPHGKLPKLPLSPHLASPPPPPILPLLSFENKNLIQFYFFMNYNIQILPQEQVDCQFLIKFKGCHVTCSLLVSHSHPCDIFVLTSTASVHNMRTLLPIFQKDKRSNICTKLKTKFKCLVICDLHSKSPLAVSRRNSFCATTLKTKNILLHSRYFMLQG